VTDVFFRDMTSGTTSRVNIDTSGNQSNGSASGFPDLSDDGRYVIFSSNDSNLVPGDTNGFTDIFVRDRTLGTTVRMTLTSTGGQSNGRVLSPRTDSAASVASFASGASNLVSGDRNGVEDVFVAPRCP
jgi:Tol biopolymer transport system component